MTIEINVRESLAHSTGLVLGEWRRFIVASRMGAGVSHGRMMYRLSGSELGIEALIDVLSVVIVDPK